MSTKLILKLGDKLFYIIGGITIAVFAVIMIVLFVNTGEKTPVTFEQTWSSLESLGYEPIDSTDEYSDQSSHLKGSILAEDNNIRFNFFEFDNNDSAYTLFQNNHSFIYEKREVGFREWDEHYDNYAMYSMSSNGTYYISILVGNTAILAYGDSENKDKIFKITEAIGYTDSD